MPDKAADWVFTVKYFIDNLTDNVVGPGLHLIETSRAGLNNLDFPDSLAKNSSPIWHNRRPDIPGHLNDTVINFPNITACEYRSYLIDQSVREYQGDRVSYKFIVPAGSYISPYSFNYMLPHDVPPPFRIDSVNGTFVYNPVHPLSYNTFQQYLICLQATEYRMDTDLVGGNYIPVEKQIGFVTRYLYFIVTDSADCPDLDIGFSDSIGTGTAVSGIDLRCDENPLSVFLTDPVLCNSVDSNASNLLLLDAKGDTVPVLKSVPSNCTIYKSTFEFSVFLDSALEEGTYTLLFRTGDDGNTLITECGLELTPFRDTLIIESHRVEPGKITGDTAGGNGDSLRAECGSLAFTLLLSDSAQCTSVTPLGSDFTLYRTDVLPPLPVAIKSAAPENCTDNYTSAISIDLINILQPGTYLVSLVTGSDGNRLIDACFRNWNPSSVVVVVEDLSPDIGDDFAYCSNTVLDTILDAGAGYGSYSWNTGSLSRFLKIDTAGIYWVSVSSFRGCSKTDTIVVTEKNCSTGIDGRYGDAGYRLCPNPNNGEFVVSGLKEIDRLRIFDTDGRTVFEKMVAPGTESATIHLPSSVKDGLYMVWLSGTDKNYGKKVLIQRAVR